MKHAVLIALCLVGPQTLAPTPSLADVLRCKLEGFSDDVFITTSPDTNSSDGQYARIGISRGIGNRAFVVADRMGATAFVELNADDTPECGCVYPIALKLRAVVANLPAGKMPNQGIIGERTPMPS